MSSPKVTPKGKRRHLDMRGSEAFRTWWRSRSKMDPVPSDPYRAFMIDRSLTAKITPKGEWEKRTNRADVIPIDYPPRPPTKVTRRVPRKPRPKPTDEQTARERKLRRRLSKISKEMLGEYGIEESVSIKVKTGDVETGTFLRDPRWGIHRYSGAIVHQPEKRAQIQVGFPVGSSFVGAEEKFRHEVGHLIDRKLLQRTYGMEAWGEHMTRLHFKPPETKGEMDWRNLETFRGERRAWKIAREFAPKPSAQARWKQRFALQTYRRSTGLDILTDDSGTEYKYTFGGLRPGITLEDIGLDPDIGKPRKGISVTSPDGSYRWEIKPRKPIRLV